MGFDLRKVISKVRIELFLDLFFNILSLLYFLLLYKHSCKVASTSNLYTKTVCWCFLFWFFGLFLTIFTFTFECHEDLWVSSLQIWARFCFFLFSLENRALTKSEHFTIDFSHKSHWDVRQKVKDIDSSPCCFTIKISRVRPRVCSWTLHENWAFWQTQSTIFVPFSKFQDIISFSFCKSSISMELFS